jgi:microcin C transport system permease protein
VTTYVLRRLLLMIPTLFGISLIVFFLVQIVPGGPVEQAIQRMRMGGSNGEAGATHGTSAGLTEDAVQQLRKFYGFDKPLPVRYALWLGKVLRLDFGKSYNYREDVWKLIRARIPVSMAIGLTGFLISYVVCIPLGVYKAIHHRTWKDAFSSLVVFVGYAIPGFALGMVLLVLFGGGSFWNLIPLSGLESDDHATLSAAGKAWDVIHHLIAPLICYMVGGFATITVLMKNSIMENLSADYVRTALAKGLSFQQALYKHALRNSLIPIATGFGSVLGVIVTSSLLIETVFGIQGIGRLSFDALAQRDYPVTLGVIIVASALTLLGNLVSDVLYVVIDPRISFEAAA